MKQALVAREVAGLLNRYGFATAANIRERSTSYPEIDPELIALDHELVASVARFSALLGEPVANVFTRHGVDDEEEE